METSQDGIIVLVVFTKVFYQLLTHFLKTESLKHYILSRYVHSLLANASGAEIKQRMYL